MARGATSTARLRMQPNPSSSVTPPQAEPLSPQPSTSTTEAAGPATNDGPTTPIKDPKVLADLSWQAFMAVLNLVPPAEAITLRKRRANEIRQRSNLLYRHRRHLRLRQLQANYTELQQERLYSRSTCHLQSDH